MLPHNTPDGVQRASTASLDETERLIAMRALGAGLLVMTTISKQRLSDSCMPWRRPKRQPDALIDRALDSIEALSSRCGSENNAECGACTCVQSNRAHHQTFEGTFRRVQTSFPHERSHGKDRSLCRGFLTGLSESCSTLWSRKDGVAALLRCRNSMLVGGKETSEQVGAEFLRNFSTDDTNRWMDTSLSQVPHSFVRVRALCIDQKFRSLQLCCVALVLSEQAQQQRKSYSTE